MLKSKGGFKKYYGYTTGMPIETLVNFIDLGI